MNSETQIAVQGDAEFDISDLLTDPKLELEGVWCAFGKGREVRIARSSNERAEALMRNKYRVNRVLLEQDDDSAHELNIKLMMEVTAQHIITGLRTDGVEVKYTPAIGLKLLKQSKDFRDKVTTFSKNMELYKAKAEEEAVKD